MRVTHALVVGLLLAGSLAAPGLAGAQPSLDRSRVGVAGARATGGGFVLHGTLGSVQALGIAGGASSVEGGFWYEPTPDSDGDGWADALDCDPFDPLISPSGLEVPDDGIDQDCDLVDATLCLEDFDGDGWGQGAIVALSGTCSAPGLVAPAWAGDCDDGDASVYPGATELPDDGVDQSCDGDDATICFTDGDGDGHGDPNTAAIDLDGECDLPGQVPLGQDCDDADPDRFPGHVEVLGDGIDQDCNGTDQLECFVDGDGDGAGAGPPSLAEEACPAGLVGVDGDCDDGDPSISPLLVELCNGGVDDDCDPGTTEDGDEDGDGWTVCGGDCDGSDAGVYPGAIELCDPGDVDHDCDPLTDPDETDADEDGARVCDGDCDDDDPLTLPGAQELCDDLDNDCDGAIETDAEITFFLWYYDADGDGFGDGNAPHPAGPDCDQPAPGYVTQIGDCDDADPSIHPAAEEVCDGIDNDCAILTTLDGLDLDADGDGYLACDEQDCDDADRDVSPDATEVCDDGIDNDCDGLADGEDAVCLDAGCTGCTEGGDAGPGAWWLVLGLVGVMRRRRGRPLLRRSRRQGR